MNSKIHKEIMRWQQNDIPSKILKGNSKVFTRYFHEKKFKTRFFHLVWKTDDASPAFKKKSKNTIDNFRPISILPSVSKVQESSFYNQIQTYFDEILSKYQCGFHKGFNAQHYRVSMIEKWKESMDNSRAFGALMTDSRKLLTVYIMD